MNKITIVVFFIIASCHCAVYAAVPQESTCYGTTKKGRIENAVSLPSKGTNYKAYSSLAKMLGRTYVHSEVRNIILNAYASLERSHPDKIFMHGEAGLKKGGRFKPHKTHQNGLSVDFMVPVFNKKNKSVPLPTSLFNKYGYAIQFDNKGKYKELTIDFEALAAQIKALHIEAKNMGIDVWRVIFDPRLQPFLYAAKDGEYIKKNILIPKKKSWVRHDDHFHIDFKISCKSL